MGVRRDWGATTTGRGAAKFSHAAFGAWLGLIAVLVILLSILAPWRLANPLSELAVAVEQLGGSGDAPLLPQKGPRELQVTIDAFNRMQERLRRFNAVKYGGGEVTLKAEGRLVVLAVEDQRRPRADVRRDLA